MRIDFEPDLTSDVHFANTGVRYSSSYVEIKGGGNTIVGRSAHEAYYAMQRNFKYKNVGIEKEIKFLKMYKKLKEAQKKQDPLN
jgi:hypothetical protein